MWEGRAREGRAAGWVAAACSVGVMAAKAVMVAAVAMVALMVAAVRRAVRCEMPRRW